MRSGRPVLIVLLIAGLSPVSYPQQEPKTIDRLLETSPSILVVKCERVGPVNILLRAVVDVEIIHVVKGPRLPARISFMSQVGMEPGQHYLIISDRDPGEDGRAFWVAGRHSVVHVHSAEEANELKKFSPRIAVLRTMNLRSFRLESDIRSLTYELDALNHIRKDN